jgi:hypothetical protein
MEVTMTKFLYSITVINRLLEMALNIRANNTYTVDKDEAATVLEDAVTVIKRKDKLIKALTTTVNEQTTDKEYYKQMWLDCRKDRDAFEDKYYDADEKADKLWGLFKEANATKRLGWACYWEWADKYKVQQSIVDDLYSEVTKLRKMLKESREETQRALELEDDEYGQLQVLKAIIKIKSYNLDIPALAKVFEEANVMSACPLVECCVEESPTEEVISYNCRHRCGAEPSDCCYCTNYR